MSSVVAAPVVLTKEESKALKANLLKNLNSQAKAAAATVKEKREKMMALEDILTFTLAVAANAPADDPEVLPTVDVAAARSQLDAAMKALADANAYAKGIATAIKVISTKSIGAEKLRLAEPEGSTQKPTQVEF